MNIFSEQHVDIYSVGHNGNPVEKIGAGTMLVDKDFVKNFCLTCGTQRCEGVGTEWFDGCKFKDYLKK